MRSQIASFLKAFDLKAPIIQAPMAGASTLDLAALITNAGGLGSIPLGSYSENAEGIELQVSRFQKLVDNVNQHQTVNLNFFSHLPPRTDRRLEEEWVEKFRPFYQQAGRPDESQTLQISCPYTSFKEISHTDHPTVQALLSIRPKIVSFHFGLPQIQILEKLQEGGIKIFVTVTNIDEFKEVLAANVDGVILQGWEAGGHRGNFIANDHHDQKLTTMELVKLIVDYVEKPTIEITEVPFLIAAGGLYDGDSIAEVLDLGIAGVQLGTVWLPTDQSTISSPHRELLLQKVDPRPTIMTAAISGRNLRTIESDFLSSLSQTPTEEIPDYPLPYSVFKKLASGKTPQSLQYKSYLAGGNYYKSARVSTDSLVVFNELLQELDAHNYTF